MADEVLKFANDGTPLLIFSLIWVSAQRAEHLIARTTIEVTRNRIAVGRPRNSRRRTDVARITRPEMFMDIARTVSKRATCQRLSVGAVLVKDRSIVSIGYNGAPAGEEHCLGNECPGKYKCELTIHAEANAIDHLPTNIDWIGLDLYVTDSPCEECYQQILEFGGIERIFFGTPYRINEHLTHPRPGGYIAPRIYRITPSGYVMDWRTKELVDVPT
jgi:dCMP deaminase